MSLYPQTAAVLRHMTLAGSITAAEAATCHRVRHLPARIHEIRKAGHPVSASRRTDVNGQRYVRYSLTQPSL